MPSYEALKTRGQTSSRQNIFRMLYALPDSLVSGNVGTSIVTDRRATGLALAEVLGAEIDITILGVSGPSNGLSLLNNAKLRVLIVNLSLAANGGGVPALEFIRAAKKRRPDVGILSLKRKADEDQLRAALDAGADACCLTVTQAPRLCKAVKVVADGATWLDKELARALFRKEGAVAGAAAVSSPRLSPREFEILALLIEGNSNREIADELLCSLPTVRTHLTHLYQKIGVEDRVSAAVYALRNGIV